jgi:NAD(P)-dependent dehydrogenase (short-subunit alcohol dehydrogenase family)
MSGRSSIDLTGRVVAITGVSSGLGRALVLECAAAGALVAGCARRAELGKELQDEVSAAGGELHFVEADMRDAAAAARFVESAVERFGRVDALVNNAAARTAPAMLPFAEVGEDNWDLLLETNVKGPFFASQAAIRSMRTTGGGVILNVASYTGSVAVSGMATYGISKAALIQMSKAIAVEHAAVGIRSIAIMLGKTATSAQQRYTSALTDDSTVDGRAAGDPEIAAQDPREVARAMILLMSDESALLTGSVVSIDRAISAGMYTSRYTRELLSRN